MVRSSLVRAAISVALATLVALAALQLTGRVALFVHGLRVDCAAVLTERLREFE